ncbi:right-handed parallel beta-helix repeat-containing protein [Wenxinia saemankumensis]|nr:right-handed parallel beta-helix repeat-containing protein [Wenxinia saemankumensis]
MIRRVAVVLALVIVAAGQAEARILYVSPLGDDGWSGRQPEPSAGLNDGPLATLDAARDAARRSPGPDRIVLRGGGYHLSAPVTFDSRDAGLTLEAEAGEHPVLHGGPAVTGWTEIAPGHWIAPVQLPPGSVVRGVFLGGDRQEEARFPDAPADHDPRGGWLFVVPPSPEDAPLGNVRFRARPGDLPPVGDPIGVVVHVTGGFLPGSQWGSDTLPVERIDGDVVQVQGTGYFFTGAGSRYFLTGAESFLDAPGEWWFDDDARLLHYLSAPGTAPEGVTVAVVPIFLHLVDTSDITIAGLTLRDGAPQGSGKFGTDMRGFGAIRVERSARIRIAANVLRNVGVAIHVSESGSVAIEENDIARVAGNAIYFGTEYGSFGRSDDGAIVGNLIRDVGEVYLESAGIWFQAAARLRIEDNLIERAAQFGIAGGSLWGDQDASHDVLIAGNVVREANRLTADGGAIKMMGAQSTPLDSAIRDNVVMGTDQLMVRPDGTFWPPRYENLAEWPGPVSWAIYLDGRASGVAITGNRLDGNVAGIGINGGWSNEVRDNLIVGGAGCPVRVDDATGRGWRPDWARPNTILDNVAEVGPAGCTIHVNAPDHGTGYVTIGPNRFLAAGDDASIDGPVRRGEDGSTH